MLSSFPIEDADLRGAFDTSGNGLVDVDVLDTGVVFVMFNGECERSDSDRFACKPANALQSEDLIGRVTQRLVLRVHQYPSIDLTVFLKIHTMTYLPLRSRVVKEDGAAIGVPSSDVKTQRSSVRLFYSGFHKVASGGMQSSIQESHE